MRENRRYEIKKLMNKNQITDIHHLYDHVYC